MTTAVVGEAVAKATHHAHLLIREAKRAVQRVITGGALTLGLVMAQMTRAVTINRKVLSVSGSRELKLN